MKRADLEAMGLSKEQIDTIMAENGKDIQAEKAKTESLKAKADSADALQKQLDDIAAQNMSEVEKANKALELANSRIAELEKSQALSTRRTSIAEKWKLTAEQASQILKDDGTFDDDLLGQIISEKEVAAATAKEKEIANGSTNPGGGKGATDTRTDAEKLVGTLFSENKSSEQSVISHYVNN